MPSYRQSSYRQSSNRQSSRRRRLVAGAVVGGALLAGQLVVSAPADAAAKSPWLSIPTSGLGIIDVPDVVRVGNQLQVVWTQKDHGQLRTAIVSGGAVTANVAVQPTWATLDETPAVFLLPDG